jgi:hypothetical protein
MIVHFRPFADFPQRPNDLFDYCYGGLHNLALSASRASTHRGRPVCPFLIPLNFDCYGTLIDWETGAITALRPLLLRHGIALSDDEIVTAFQDIDGALCEPPYKPYRAVLAGVVDGFGRRFGFPVEAADREVLASSVASWRPFPDTVAALRALGGRYPQPLFW